MIVSNLAAAAVSAFGFGGINAHMILEESNGPNERDSHKKSR
jgi:acyl transferase domain-containing protein